MLNPEYSNPFETFKIFTDNIKINKHFSFVRFNDGELGMVLKRDPIYSAVCKRWGKQMSDECEKLLNILNKPLRYFVGVDSKYLRGIENEFTEIINPNLNLVTSHVFHYQTKDKFLDFLNILKEKNTIIVGPDYLKDLNFQKEHVITPIEFVWKSTQTIKKDIIERVSKYDNVIIIYSASIATNYLIDEIYDELGDKVTQIDIGSTLDPYCGVASRTGHFKFMEDNNIKVKTIITRK